MSFPNPNSTQSFWRNKPHELDNHRSTKELPREVDIVIIGAGYTGAAIGHHILEISSRSEPQPSILILEAREACSGATGRNGGHLKPDLYSRAAAAVDKYGPEAAEEVASFEARQVDEVQHLVEREGIECDYVQTTGLDVFLYDGGYAKTKASLEKLGGLGLKTMEDVHSSQGEAAEGISGVKGAKGCFTSNAAHLWPYKLVTHLLAKAVQSGVNLQTHTPVSAVSRSQDPQTHPWTMTTRDRGTLQARKIVFATNAYTSNLLPEFKDKIVPVRGICSRIVSPKEDHQRPPLLSNSYSIRFNEWEYDYLITRNDGSIIVGGARRDFMRDLSQWYGVTDDSKLIEPAAKYFDGYMQRMFSGWEDSGAYTESVWTGIMGYSNDNMPYVGEVPGKSGQFVCAGFSGHGMPQIFLSAKAVADMVVEGKSVEQVDLPRLYRASRERLDEEGNVHLEAWRAIPKEAGSRSKL